MKLGVYSARNSSANKDGQMAILAYTRVSMDGQTLDGRVLELKTAGAAIVFKEKISGQR
jgi:hypothetical protein